MEQFVKSVENNNLEALSALYKVQPELFNDNFAAFVGKHNKDSVYEWALSVGINMDAAIIVAIKHASYDVLEAAGATLCTMKQNACLLAAMAGNYWVMVWLHDRIGVPLVPELLALAKADERSDIVMWLAKEGTAAT